MLINIASKTEAFSLEQSSSMVFTDLGFPISKQSIDSRFNSGAIEFVKGILKQIIENQLNKSLDSRFLPRFNRICIKDGTRFNLPDRLSQYYKGSGGDKGTSNASVCIQFEYDAFNGKVLSLDITNGTRNDHTDAKETAARAMPGDLILRDLGYYSLPILNSFNQNSISFISRLGAKTTIIDPQTGNEILFKELYAQMLKQKTATMERTVIVGKKEQMPLRLVVSIVPEEVYQKRIRKIEKVNKENGYNTSDDYRARCHFNLFITNIGPQGLTIEQLHALYKMRWQIELMFKNWKSVYKIDELLPMKYERFTCLLYAKLILIVINLQLIWNLKRYYYQKEEKILSMFKCFKTLQLDNEILYGLFQKKRETMAIKLKALANKFSRDHWKEKRKNRTNYEDILDLFICNSK